MLRCLKNTIIGSTRQRTIKVRKGGIFFAMTVNHSCHCSRLFVRPMNRVYIVQSSPSHVLWSTAQKCDFTLAENRPESSHRHPYKHYIFFLNCRHCYAISICSSTNMLSSLYVTLTCAAIGEKVSLIIRNKIERKLGAALNSNVRV